MSIVVAARTLDGITMACDSQVTDGYLKESVTERKVWTNGVAICGAVGDLRTVQVIRYNFPPATADKPSVDTLDYLVTTFVPFLQKLASLHGTLVRNDDGRSGMDANLIVAWDDVIAVIDQTFSVMISDKGRAALGTGAEVALGYLGNEGPWTESHVIQSAKRAVLLSVNVSGPVYYVDTKSLQVKEAV